MKNRILLIALLIIANSLPMKSTWISTCTSCYAQSPKQLMKRAVKKSIKKSAKKEAKASVRTTAKKTERKTVRVMSKGVLREIPTGKDALKVIAHADGSFTPAIHNLNENAAKYSDEFNRLLLKERRSAVTHAHQYISPEKLKTTTPKTNLTEASSRRKLRENIYARMEDEYANVAKAFGGTEAHHVVEGNAKSAQASREILKKFGIGINDAENGVLLRSDASSIYPGALHNTSHAEKYSEYVYSKIKDVKTRDELVLRLADVKKALVDGSLDLAGNIIR